MPIVFIPNVVDVSVYLDWTHLEAYNTTRIPEEPYTFRIWRTDYPIISFALVLFQKKEQRMRYTLLRCFTINSIRV